jgi:hypothetical protein
MQLVESADWNCFSHETSLFVKQGVMATQTSMAFARAAWVSAQLPETACDFPK